MQRGISTDLAWKAKQSRMLELKTNKPTVEELRRPQQRAPSPKFGREHAGGLVWSGTCAPALRTYSLKKKKREKKMPVVINSEIMSKFTVPK